LFTGDWYIHQMQAKMNESAPLPITMPYDKYKEGVRDVIYFDDKKIQAPVEVKEVFDFITSDDKSMQAQYQSGDYGNYLPTKNFKLTINADDVLKNHVITPDQKDRLATEMDWKFTSNYITKENLAMLDILAHNNWVRPICFTTTIGMSNLIGLQPYLYKEGFAYHLIPFKPDTTVKDQLGKINSLVMYNNMMNKFKYGNFKHARYLDHESTTMFYPVMLTTFFDLAQGLIKDGHPDLALKTLHKFDDEMPGLVTGLDVADRKMYMGRTAYKLNDMVLGNKLISNVDDYVTDQLDYNYTLLKNNSSELNTQNVQYGVSFINEMGAITAENHQTELSNKLKAQLKDYEAKFGAILQRPQ
jgi:hypothetical protein